MEFAQTKQFKLTDKLAVPVFIAADALDVETARQEAETFLGTKMLTTDRGTFCQFWQMSQVFYMKILEQFLDNLCLNNFGWFWQTLGQGATLQYLRQWDLPKLAAHLQERRFTNCSEEQLFYAVVGYCKESFTHFYGREAAILKVPH